MKYPLPPMAYIIRTDRPYSHGWIVRFASRGCLLTKYFADRAYIDGRKESLFWAQQWRDEKYKRLLKAERIAPYHFGIGHHLPPAFCSKPSQKNKSGLVGVRLRDYHTTDQGYPRHFWAWVASWQEYTRTAKGLGVKCRVRCFSCYKYGFDTARQKAIACRKRAEKYLKSSEHLELRDTAIKRRWQARLNSKARRSA
jgi:hypothetical protein